jgi:hypothetical protein
VHLIFVLKQNPDILKQTLHFPENMAYLKPAYQASNNQADSYEASVAVDGVVDSYLKEGSCTLTQHETRAWWMVDLLTDRAEVLAVKITNRGDCCGNDTRFILVDLIWAPFHKALRAPFPSTFHIILGAIFLLNALVKRGPDDLREQS